MYQNVQYIIYSNNIVFNFVTVKYSFALVRKNDTTLIIMIHPLFTVNTLQRLDVFSNIMNVIEAVRHIVHYTLTNSRMSQWQTHRLNSCIDHQKWQVRLLTEETITWDTHSYLSETITHTTHEAHDIWKYIHNDNVVHVNILRTSLDFCITTTPSKY